MEEPIFTRRSGSPTPPKPPEDSPRGGGSTASEGAPGKVELKINIIARSEKPVDGLRGENPVDLMERWYDYTIVSTTNMDRISLYDKDARLLSGLDHISTKVAGVNWNKLGEGLNVKFLTKGISSRFAGGQIEVENLPLFAKTLPTIKWISFGSGGSYVRMEHISNDVTFRTDTAASSRDGRYVVLSAREGGLAVLRTCNDSGITQQPRNWQRFDHNTNLPGKDILDEVELAYKLRFQAERGVARINDAYVYKVSTDKVEIFDNQSKVIFTDRIPTIGFNVCKDPTNPNVIYYAKSGQTNDLYRLDLSGEAAHWQSKVATLGREYQGINMLRLDPSGICFCFYEGQDLVFAHKETLEEVGRFPGYKNVIFDPKGNVRMIDGEGRLVIAKINFDEIDKQMEVRRLARITQGIKITDLFSSEAEKKEQATHTGGRNLDHLEPLREQYQTQFAEIIVKVDTQEGVGRLREGLTRLTHTLRGQGMRPDEVTFIVESLESPVAEKEKEFAAKETREALDAVKAKLVGSLSVTSIGEVRAEIERVRATEALLPEDLRREFRDTLGDFERQSLEFFNQRGGEVIKDVEGLVVRTRTDLEGFASKGQMDDWLEFRYPQIRSRLAAIATDVPLQAEAAYKAIVAARGELAKIAGEFEHKFKEQYAKVREVAVERMEATVDTLEADIAGLVERLRSKSFATREAAEQYLSSSDAKKLLEEEIAAITSANPDVAKELDRALKVRISNTLTEIERGGMTQVAETGQQMILFGATQFPKWEAKVHEKGERKVEVVFDEDERTHGAGVKAGDILGDVVVTVTTSMGKVENVRLFEGLSDENDWRLGLVTYRGIDVPPSYLTAAEYRKVKKDYIDWAKGEKSKLQKELAEKRQELRDIYNRRQKVRSRTEGEDTAWKAEYQAKLQEYGKFAAEHHTPLLRRIEQIKAEPELEYTNGKGFVPEWQGHWVNDLQTEVDLEEMAKAFKMQIDLQEGLLNLKGHAGTGKDVRLKMFCSLTHRPYFGIDCTKWTTEIELSEDLVLESKDGASQTVWVPSAVLNGITTPGAVVYFNEFNAMPEQAQIFLHALMDEKRSLTLKTRSGKTIRALPSVLLAGSMNPGYPGTFDPQFATRSRMISLEIGYPPLTRLSDPGDTNPNLPYDASEALRIARGVDSLVDLTYEASLERNEFVRMWDKYVNGIENGSPEPTSTQRFDIDTTLALVQFANNLRGEFIKLFEKTREARNALPVSQPITGRELRRCAYALSKMTPAEKATANSEVVARTLLDKYFLTHIDKKEDQDKIRTAMNTWTSRKRVRP